MSNGDHAPNPEKRGDPPPKSPTPAPRDPRDPRRP